MTLSNFLKLSQILEYLQNPDMYWQVIRLVTVTGLLVLAPLEQQVLVGPREQQDHKEVRELQAYKEVQV
jgi:hypothetical protein